MVKDELTSSLKAGGVTPIKEFLKSEQLNKWTTVVSTKKAIDSSNFGVCYFEELALIIEENYQKYDSFLVLMGTDTMAYVSSLLSYCIKGLDKSILFSGGQFPLNNKNSDSKENLREALIGLSKNKYPKEVGVYFANKWHRAVGVTKIDTNGLDAYLVPNFNSKNWIREKESLKITKNIKAKIGVVKLIPFGNEEVLRAILESNKLNGLILEVFGTGNMPDFSEELQKLFTIKVNKGLKVVLVSQCLKGEVSIGKYASSLNAQKLGFVSGSNLTVESCVAKMMFLHRKKLNPQQYQSFFEDSIRGE